MVWCKKYKKELTSKEIKYHGCWKPHITGREYHDHDFKPCSNLVMDI